MEKPVKAKTIGRMQQKLATTAAKTEPAANQDVGLFDRLDGAELESELQMPEFASRIAWRKLRQDHQPVERPTHASVGSPHSVLWGMLYLVQAVGPSTAVRPVFAPLRFPKRE